MTLVVVYPVTDENCKFAVKGKLFSIVGLVVSMVVVVSVVVGLSVVVGVGVFMGVGMFVCVWLSSFFMFMVMGVIVAVSVFVIHLADSNSYVV